MFGPGMGGPHGRMMDGMHMGMGCGPRPMMPMNYGFYHRRHNPMLGIGLSALVGTLIGSNIASRNNQTTYTNNNTRTSNVYEYYNYCPNCGEKRTDSSKYCSYCGSSLIR